MNGMASAGCTAKCAACYCLRISRISRTVVGDTVSRATVTLRLGAAENRRSGCCTRAVGTTILPSIHALPVAPAGAPGAAPPPACGTTTLQPPARHPTSAKGPTAHASTPRVPAWATPPAPPSSRSAAPRCVRGDHSAHLTHNPAVRHMGNSRDQPTRPGADGGVQLSVGQRVRKALLPWLACEAACQCLCTAACLTSSIRKPC